MKILIMGPQGSGKGTQAKMIAKKYKLKHLSMGDILREASNDAVLGPIIKKHVDKGELVPNKFVIKLLKKQLGDNFILDGFPRSIEQAQMLDEITDIDKIIYIDIDDKEAIKRISGRRQCKACGKIYNLNIEGLKPKGRECECDGTLYQRDDDKIKAIKKRLKIFRKETLPLLNYYGDIAIKINGKQEPKKVFRDIVKALEQNKKS